MYSLMARKEKEKNNMKFINDWPDIIAVFNLDKIGLSG